MVIIISPFSQNINFVSCLSNFIKILASNNMWLMQNVSHYYTICFTEYYFFLNSALCLNFFILLHAFPLLKARLTNICKRKSTDYKYIYRGILYIFSSINKH
uniref:Uncharacterized protein n=1 Tax=Octopus bimaculoides TaxID=37653 RepID=A0A0L8GMJ2_OCTBM